MPNNDNQEIKIGVYTCYCGGNISDVVDCEGVAEQLAKFPNVVVSRTNMAMCSDVGQSMIEEDIREKGINRIVIGACAPSLHEQTFRGAVTRAGLNPYLYYHVGLREQDSWVHKCDCEGASIKAVRLMATGLGKARLLDPLAPIQLNAEKHALVIGGGIAGLKSALDIAQRGLRVTLIEKSPFLGGRVAQLDTLFPTNENARDTVKEMINKVIAHPNIVIYTQALEISPGTEGLPTPCDNHAPQVFCLCNTCKHLYKSGHGFTVHAVATLGPVKNYLCNMLFLIK